MRCPWETASRLLGVIPAWGAIPPPDVGESVSGSPPPGWNTIAGLRLCAAAAAPAVVAVTPTSAALNPPGDSESNPALTLGESVPAQALLGVIAPPPLGTRPSPTGGPAIPGANGRVYPGPSPTVAGTGMGTRPVSGPVPPRESAPDIRLPFLECSSRPPYPSPRPGSTPTSRDPMLGCSTPRPSSWPGETPVLTPWIPVSALEAAAAALQPTMATGCPGPPTMAAAGTCCCAEYLVASFCSLYRIVRRNPAAATVSP